MPAAADVNVATEEQEIIARAPVLIFFMVAAADGDIDEKELVKFQTILKTKTHAVLVAMMQQGQAGIGDIIQEFVSGQRNPTEELRRLAHVLDHRVPGQVGMLIKISLFSLAKQTVEASGGFPGTLGNMTSNEKSLVLRAIGQAFGLGEAPVFRTT